MSFFQQFSLSENDYSEEFSPNDSESTQQVLSPLKGELPAAEAFSPSILKKGRCTFKFHKACQTVSSGEFYTFSKSVYTGAVVTSGVVNEKATQTIIGGRILLLTYN